jgi:hypothetical protein
MPLPVPVITGEVAEVAEATLYMVVMAAKAVAEVVDLEAEAQV